MRIGQLLSFLKKNRVDVALSVLTFFIVGAVLFTVIYTTDAYQNVRYPDSGFVQSVPFENLSDLSGAEEMSYGELSDAYAALDPTCEVWTEYAPTESEPDKKGGLYFISKDNLEFCIFHADADSLTEGQYSLNNFDHMWLNSEHNFFYMVINLAGKEIDLSDYYVLARDDTFLYASRVLINCYEAETVNLDGSIFTGTLLAPQATVTCADTYLYGQILAKDVTGTYKANKIVPFTGYQSIMDGLATVHFQNEGVRLGAIRYLKAHNTDGRYDRYTEDSQVLKRDLQEITALSIQDCTLSGLEQDLAQFPNLTSLKIRKTDLTHLSLLGQGELLELEITDTPLVDLDLSGVPLLQRLIVERTAIEELSFSAVPNLAVLSYQGTPLGWMDYSALTKLQYLDCSDSGIDVSCITGETLPELLTLRVAQNIHVTEIDLSTFAKLARLDCASCSLTEINLEYFTHLQYLRCSNNQITSLDFSGFKQLFSVECYGSSLQSMIVTNWAEAAYADCPITRVQG